MSKSPLFGFCSAAALAGMVLLSSPAPRCPWPTPRAAHAGGSERAQPAEIDKRLQVAQKQLEQAANEVARLSTQLSDTMLSEVMPLVGPHVIIGVQLEKAADHTGARVREVSPGGPAAEAGIRVDDVIVAVNGTELKGENPPHQLS
jgi:C-terminal processing protease CtpA/Prc